jgi:hypothetical protein
MPDARCASSSGPGCSGGARLQGALCFQAAGLALQAQPAALLHEPAAGAAAGRCCWLQRTAQVGWLARRSQPEGAAWGPPDTHHRSVTAQEQDRESSPGLAALSPVNSSSKSSVYSVSISISSSGPRAGRLLAPPLAASGWKGGEEGRGRGAVGRPAAAGCRLSTAAAAAASK